MLTDDITRYIKELEELHPEHPDIYMKLWSDGSCGFYTSGDQSTDFEPIEFGDGEGTLDKAFESAKLDIMAIKLRMAGYKVTKP